jgi:hypothetical protein
MAGSAGFTILAFSRHTTIYFKICTPILYSELQIINDAHFGLHSLRQGFTNFLTPQPPKIIHKFM